MAIRLITLCLIIIQMALADLETPNGVFKTSCFSNKNDGGCEHSRIKICHDFYACDLVVQFHSPIKRIGVIDEEILVAEGFNTYLIDDRKMEAKKVKKVIPPLNEFVDKQGNKYYAGEGTTYVSHKESGKELEIVTTGEYSFNQLAIDKEANLLFILTFPSANKEKREGKLYGVVLDPLVIVDDKVKADFVEGDYNITAIAVAGSLEKLVLGINTEDGSKFIRLSRQYEDPCVVLKSPQTEIKNVLKTTEKKLMEIFEENLISLSVRNTEHEKEKQNLQVLEEQNANCNIQLGETRKSFETFTATISSYSQSLSTSNSFLLESSNGGSTSTSQAKQKEQHEKHDDKHHDSEKKECLPSEDIEYMVNTIKQLEQREIKLREQLWKYETDLSDILNPNLNQRIGSDASENQDQITFREREKRATHTRNTSPIFLMRN